MKSAVSLFDFFKIFTDFSTIIWGILRLYFRDIPVKFAIVWWNSKIISALVSQNFQFYYRISWGNAIFFCGRLTKFIFNICTCLTKFVIFSNWSWNLRYFYAVFQRNSHFSKIDESNLRLISVLVWRNMWFKNTVVFRNSRLYFYYLSI